MNKGNIATLSTGIFADSFHTVSMVWKANRQSTLQS